MPFFSFDDDEFFGDLLLMGAAGGGKSVEATATGNPLTFQTDLARPLKSLLIPFTPVQSGSGDPSPQNVRPIIPWNGLTVFGGGESLFPFVKTEYEATSNYNGYDTETAIPDSFIGQKLTYSAYFDNTNSAEPSSVRIWGKDKNDSWMWLGSAGNEIGAGAKGTSHNTILIPQNVAWIGFGMNMKAGSKYSQPMVELGQTATAYEPYKPITETDISFPSPVYGGTPDIISGRMMVGWTAFDMGSLEWTLYGNNDRRQAWSTTPQNIKPTIESIVTEALCDTFKPVSYDSTWSPGAFAQWRRQTGESVLTFCVEPSAYGTPEEFKEAMTGRTICYPLATPHEITLTAEQITALKGDNTIWSDADGSMTAVYLKKG